MVLMKLCVLELNENMRFDMAVWSGVAFFQFTSYIYDELSYSNCKSVYRTHHSHDLYFKI